MSMQAVLQLLAVLRTVVLSEVGANPLNETACEFVELINTGAQTQCLGGWSLTDGDALDVLLPWDTLAHGPFPHQGMLLGTDTLPPGAVALVFELDYAGEPAYNLPEGTLILTTGDHSICNGLAASSDPLTLFDAGGTADSNAVSTYGTPVPSDDWSRRDDDGLDGIPFDPGDGFSVERYPLSAPDAEGSWRASVRGGTPGLPPEAPPDTVNVSCDSVWTEPEEPPAGEPFLLCATFTNAGNVPPEDGELTLFLDLNADSVASQEEVLASQSAAGLPPGGSVTLTAWPTLAAGWYAAAGRADAGGDIDPTDDCRAVAAAAGGGVCPVITEVFANPTFEDTDEMVEVYYPGPGTYPMAGSSLTDGDALDGIVRWEGEAPFPCRTGHWLRAGNYALVLDPEHPQSPTPYSPPDSTLLCTVGNTTIGNGLTTTDPVVLYRPGGTTISDMVSTYGTPVLSDDPLLCDDDGLNDIPFDPGDGFSVERRSHDMPDEEWCWAASPPGGTPGLPAFSSDTTNAAIDTVIVSPGGPDPGEPLSLTAVLRNAGTTPVTGMSVDFFLDADGDSLAGPAELISTHSPPDTLYPGSSDTLEAETTAPEAGEYLAAARVSCPGDGDRSDDAALCPFGSGGGVPLVITEVVCNPENEDTDEMVELCFPGPGIATLDGMRLTDGDALDVLVAWPTAVEPPSDPDAVVSPYLQAGCYAVVLDREYAQGGEPWDLAPGTVVLTTGNTTIGDGLTSTDPLTLYGRGGTGTEDVHSTYGTPVPSDDWSQRDDDGLDDIPRDPGEGQSLQRRSTDLPDEEDSWLVSPDGPTPGADPPYTPEGPDATLGWTCAMPPVGEAGTQVTVTAMVVSTGTDSIRTGSLRVILHADSGGDGLPDPDEAVDSWSAGAMAPGDTLEAHLYWTGSEGPMPLIALVDCQADTFPQGDTASCSWNDPGPLVLNELMYSPAQGEPEWIELRNTSQEAVAPALWELSDSRETVTLPEAPQPVPAGGYALLVPDSAGFAARWGDVGCPVIQLDDWPALNNTTQPGAGYADLVTLTSPGGEASDHVPYDDSWGGGSGTSLERVCAETASWRGDNWASCTCGGTPGQRNSVSGAASPEGAFLELHPDPFSPDGDGREDVLSITVRPGGTATVTLTVYNVQGRPVRELLAGETVGSVTTVSWDGTDDDGRRLHIGRYIVYASARPSDSGEVREDCLVVVLAGRL